MIKEIIKREIIAAMPRIIKATWLGYLLKRVIAAIISLFIISLIIFFLNRRFFRKFWEYFHKPILLKAERIIKEYQFR